MTRKFASKSVFESRCALYCMEVWLLVAYKALLLVISDSYMTRDSAHGCALSHCCKSVRIIGVYLNKTVVADASFCVT